MSLATRCTQCGTIFKVVQDQLKVSEGWVRCGRCQEVFNALEGLFDLEREAPPARQTPPRPAARTTVEVPPSAVATATASPSASPPASPPASAPAPAANPAPARVHDPLASDGPHPGVTHFDLDLPPGERPASQAEPVAPITTPATTPLITPSAPEWPNQAQPPVTAEPSPGLAAAQLAESDIDLSGLSALDTLNDFRGPGHASAPNGPAPHAAEPQATAPTPSSAPAYPETSETDALDSRYLLPNEEAPLKRRRKRRGPEFADAQFPHDLDAESDWDEAWSSGPGELDEATPAAGPQGVPPVAPVVPEPSAPAAQVVAHDPFDRREPSLGTEAEPRPGSAATAPAATAPGATPSAPAPAPAKAFDAGPSTVPSRFGDDFQPESPVLPPSQRQGKPGTRGRTPQPEAPGFVKQAERRAIWRHPLVRGVLSFMALGLSLLLAGQAAHHWRDELAARQPAVAPWLAQWCQVAGCQIQAPQQIDDLQVDSIQLVRTPSEGADTYRLTAIIHNRADIALRWPQLDLNLTDANGQLLVRRVFQVSDARLVPNGDADAASPAKTKAATLPPVPHTVAPNAQTTVQWQLRAPDLKLAGYTAELFYP